jgi:hypothetical protein
MSDVLNHRTRVRTGSRPPSVAPHCFSPALFAAQAVERKRRPWTCAMQVRVRRISNPASLNRQPCLSHYEFARTAGCLKLLFEKMSGAIATIGPISSPCFILGEN